MKVLKLENWEIIKPRRKVNDWYTEPAIVRCSKCGAEFEAEPDQMGECQCPECGQLYNGFGQELSRSAYDIDYLDAGEYIDDEY